MADTLQWMCGRGLPNVGERRLEMEASQCVCRTGDICLGMEAVAIKVRRDEKLGLVKDWRRKPGCGASSTCAPGGRVPG